MKRFLLLLLACLLAEAGYPAPPQQKLRFDETGHDFGTIAERDGAVSHRFRFTNVSERPVVIEEILTTCGCTVAEYDRQPVLPGQSGTICVRFDPRGRTDTFHKSIRVVTDRRGGEFTTLFVRGTILLEESTEEHLYELFDDLCVDRLTVPFGTLQRNVPRTAQELTLHNRTCRNIRLACRIEPDSGTLRVLLPPEIAPGQSARIAIEAVDAPGYRGTLRADIRLIADGMAAEQPISVFGYLVDDLRNIRLADSPRCEVHDGYFNFGRIRCGTPCTHRLTLRNTGRLPLVIRKIESPAPVHTDLKGEQTLQPGQSLPVTLTVDTRHAAAVDTDLHIISNDVRTPVRRIKVEGEIVR